MSSEVSVAVVVLLPIPNTEQFPAREGTSLVVPTPVYMYTYIAPYEIRQKWAYAIEQNFYARDVSDGIEHWDVGLYVDGRVDIRNHHIPRAANYADFPVRFRIPESALRDCVDEGDRMRRKQIFALGGILYEVLTGKELFAGLTDIRIRYRYEQGMWPEGMHQIQDRLMIMACWIQALPGPIGTYSQDIAQIWGPGPWLSGLLFQPRS